MINEDTIVPVVADQALPDLEKLSDQEILRLFEEKGIHAIEPSHHFPARILDLFDRKGIVVLKKQEDQDPNRDRPDVNRPSVIWIE